MIRIILVFFIVIFCSCSSNKSAIYYSYEDDNKYCTIEVNDGVPIYRAVNKVTNKDSLNYKFIYFKSNMISWSPLQDIYSILFNDVIFLESDSSFFQKKSLKVKDSPNSYSNSLDFEYNNGYYFFKNSGFLHITEQTLINLIGKEDWLPPYFKKVNKIDYSKFSMFNVKKKYLKNPEKKGAPQSWKE